MDDKRIPVSPETRARLDRLGQLAHQWLYGESDAREPSRQRMTTPTAVRILAHTAYETLPDDVPGDMGQFRDDIDAVAYDRSIDLLRRVPETRRNFFRKAQHRYADVEPIWASKAIAKVHGQYMASRGGCE